MSLILNSNETMLLQMVEEFSKREVLPNCMQIDKLAKYPKDLWYKVLDIGFLGLITPLEFGGAEFDPLLEAEVVYTIAKSNASLAFTLEGHYKTVNQLMKYGTKALKDKYLEQTNKKIFAFGSTEPQGGSNVSGLETTARLDKDGNYILNGNKTMITNGGLAEVYLVLARTGENEISCFLVDQDMEGFKHGKSEDFIGMRATPVGEIFLENVKVSKDHLLGKLGEGLLIGDNAHYDARINMGAIAAGIMEHALNIVADYAKERKALKTPIRELYSIQNKIVEIDIKKTNTQLLYREAAKLKNLGKSYAKVSTMAKSYGSRAAFNAADDAIQVLGGYGYSKEYPVEHLLRDARALQIAESTLEKMVVEISSMIYEERD